MLCWDLLKQTTKHLTIMVILDALKHKKSEENQLNKKILLVALIKSTGHFIIVSDKMYSKNHNVIVTLLLWEMKQQYNRIIWIWLLRIQTT